MDERYKKRGLKFNNTLDSRVLRAVTNQQRQRGRRDDVVNSRRQMEALKDSPLVENPPKNPKGKSDKQSELYQKGLERYQQLLKWKEMKKKQLQKEKKKRMPAFKTGIYQPSPPRYLVSGDTELRKTPQTLQKKGLATPGNTLRKVPVFHLGGTPATSLLRVPQFHTGMTPAFSTKKHILPSKQNTAHKNEGVARRTRLAHKKENLKVVSKPATRGRVTRQKKIINHEDLGVAPLPQTPSPAVERKLKFKIPSQTVSFPSFAPYDFTFKFQAQIPGSECPSQPQCDDQIAPAITERILQGHTDDKRDECELIEEEKSTTTEEPPTQKEDNEKILSVQTPSLQTDADSLEGNEKYAGNEDEIQLVNEGNLSLEDHNINNEDTCDMMVPEEKITGEDEASINSSFHEHITTNTLQTSESENQSMEQNCTPVEVMDINAEVSDNEMEPTTEENSSPKQEMEPKSPKNSSPKQEMEPKSPKNSSPKQEIEPKSPKNSSPKQEIESKSPKNSSPKQETEPVKQKNSSPKQEKSADISQNIECEKEMELNNKDDNDTYIHKLPEDSKSNENTEFEEVNEPSCNDEDKEDTESTVTNQMDDSVSCTSDIYTSNLEMLSPVKTTRTRRSSTRATPAKHFTRRSIACCFDGSVTPTASRLRPRTPCSRKTRRSLSAHCDIPLELFTPGRRSSARRTPRYSISKTPKLEHLHETHSTSIIESTVTGSESLHQDAEARMNVTESSLPQPDHQNTTRALHPKVMSLKGESNPSLLTPENRLQQEKGTWTLDTSPWIDHSRRSSKKKNKNRKVSDLHGMFDDIPTDGSPIPQHLIPSDPSAITTVEESVHEDTVCTNLLSLLKPSTPLDTDSPVVDVWGESPAHSVPTTPKTTNPQVSQEEKEKVLLHETVGVLENMEIKDAGDSNPTEKDSNIPDSGSNSTSSFIPSTNTNQKDIQPKKSRRSRKSVMFAIAEDDHDTTTKLPATPVCTATRMSMGIFAKLDWNVEQSLTENQDLMVFDSPKNYNKISRVKRRSNRISLLPGMTPSPSKDSPDSLPADLMSWDSPDLKSSSSNTASVVATPRRRSRRLSKLV